jgi:AraC family transcriptional regulator, glycine betaine-responsive activator
MERGKQPVGSKRATTRFGFLTLANYSLIALANAMEPLRMANRVGQGTLYDWTVLTLDGRPALASNGLSLAPTMPLAEAWPLDVLFVCGGVDVRDAVDQRLQSALREAARRGMALGGLCTGTYALAHAGVIDGYRCAIHWENMSAIREEFPRTSFTPELFVIDRNRFTCSGGIAPIDMMLNLIREQHGKELATAICEQFILDRVRDAKDQQHIPLQAQVGAHNQILIKAATLMEANVEEPLALEELASYVGVSRRQLERLFKRYLGRVPTRYYLELRLRRARELLLQTDLSVMDITVACGFQSPPHFSKCYRGLFGYPPSMERRRVRAGPHAVN